MAVAGIIAVGSALYFGAARSYDSNKACPFKLSPHTRTLALLVLIVRVI